MQHIKEIKLLLWGKNNANIHIDWSSD